METDTLLAVLNSQKLEDDSSRNPDDHDDSDKIDTVTEEENKKVQVEENKDEDNRGVVSIQQMLYEDYIYFCLDVMLYLSKELDGRSLLEKLTFIWTEWTSKDDLFKTTRNSKGSLAKDVIFFGLRY